MMSVATIDMSQFNQPQKTPRILLEVTKLDDNICDGSFRYAQHLVKGLEELRDEQLDLKIDLLIKGKIVSLDRFSKSVQEGTWAKKTKRKLIDSIVQSREFLAGQLKTRLSSQSVDQLRSFDQKLGLTQWLERYHRGFYVDTGNYDLVHLTLPQTFHLISPQTPRRLLVTIHDCSHQICPDYHVRENVEAVEQGINFALRCHSRFLTVSESTKCDFIQRYGIDPDRVSTTLLGVDHSFFKPVEGNGDLRKIRASYKIPDNPYLLALSTLEPRKNLLNTVRAFVEILDQAPSEPVNLVVAGKKGWKTEDFLGDSVMKHPNVHFPGFVEERDLPALYSGARALTFVSFYEGFGLPAVEAMSCGTPVIYGNRGSLPEVVKSAGLPADPSSVSDIKKQIELVLKNPELVRQLSLEAMSLSKKFSWKKMVRQTLEAYRSLLRSSP